MFDNYGIRIGCQLKNESKIVKDFINEIYGKLTRVLKYFRREYLA